MSDKTDLSEESTWLSEPVTRFFENATRLVEVVNLTVHGISEIQEIVRAVEVLQKYNKASGEASEKALASAQKEADLARREVSSGFSIVHSHAVIGLWSLLEELIRTVVVEWLRHQPDAFRAEAVRKLRIRLGEYLSLENDDRLYYVAELLERDLCAGLQYGASRFEAFLSPLGLVGGLPERLKRDIYEFGQIRNALVHRGSNADRQLVTVCPWLSLIAGQPLMVSRTMFDRYWKAAHYYIILLICRAGELFFSDDHREAREDVFHQYAPANILEIGQHGE